MNYDNPEKNMLANVIPNQQRTIIYIHLSVILGKL